MLLKFLSYEMNSIDGYRNSSLRLQEAMHKHYMKKKHTNEKYTNEKY